MSTNRLTEPSDSPRNLLSLACRLLLGGQILYIVVTQFHAGGDANDHHHIFATYAENAIWGAVHLGQFAGMAMLLVGLVALAFALDQEDGPSRWLGRVGAAVAVAALALYGALQAVDGVALKQAVNAWASAPEAEKAARFASAEAIRWLEWGMRSYQDFAMGLALLLFAASVARTAWISRPVGWLMGLCGLAYLAQGWIAGTQGFTPAQSVAIVLSWVLGLAWMIWLAVAARR
ncbi:hypothetical protein [Mesorhizobium sp. ORS 3428]|uniref:hypothetical protein n=1 Tax=Mesorhizobium sp. ORS 3428 TaxID=540997 RepID=UPI0008D9D036|nr:hypothetical protein [Mesorhizobium sp. ORS 3428]OHV88676.1 hypothetical protein ORS3428_17725 [Mesorhizobium sp. ORS 3428]